MNDQIKHIELLSPAKNLECGLSAINNGADAVYIGGPGFGARKQAGNSLEDIEQLVKHAHLYRSKVYLTLNTILKDNEIEQANKLIHSAYNLGVDAIIIQDMGLLETDLPPIPIHASTQTDNRTLEKVQFLEKTGFDQIVLARELSLHQIKHIRQHTNVALEYFIHGALCVCYSGQCYMSASINGRSANRGECAQPCRLKYSLKDKNGNLLYKDKHLLSLKDLNQTPNLEELIDAGISSFKIEGRLKNKDYVANITAHYRSELDQIIANRPNLIKSSSGIVIPAFIPSPQKSFNRGFTEYFANNRSDEIWSIHTPKALGELIGKVIKTGPDFFIHDGHESISNGDGLCFLDKKNNLHGLKVNTCHDHKVYPNEMKGIKTGITIYRNNDTSFQQTLLKKESQRKISLNLTLTEYNKNLELHLKDEDGIQSTSKWIIANADPALNKEKVLDQITTQLGKLGNTPFYADNIDVNFTNYWFIPMSSINELRRLAIDNHICERRKSYLQRNIIFNKSDHAFPAKQLDFKANITNQLARQFYERHGSEIIEWGFEKKETKHEIEVMSTKHCLLFMAGKCLKEHPEAAKLLPLTLFNQKDSYFLNFDCKACQMHIIKKADQ